MDRDTLVAYLHSFPGTTASYPFVEDFRVFKVVSKMYAGIPEDDPLEITLKCDPHRSELLRQTYDSVTPAYHFNKRHWITVRLDGSLSDAEVRDLIAASYALVFAKLSRAEKSQIQPHSRQVS
jgi:predicted DNA-binding protein (MmcQ/YjbR family)